MNPGLLAPSILSFDPLDLHDAVPRMLASGADLVHLDVMDGRFVPPISFGDALGGAIHRRFGAFVEAHLMTEAPETQFDAFVRAGCARIIFHVEATRHAHRLVQSLKEKGVEAGIALNPATPVEAALPILSEVDLVLVMTVNPGWGGQRFLPFTLEKVRRLREADPRVRIEVDGGVDPATVGEMRAAGADTFVVGSHLVRAASLEDATREMKILCAG